MRLYCDSRGGGMSSRRKMEGLRNIGTNGGSVAMTGMSCMKTH